MLPFAPDFPDALVGVAPVLRNVVQNALDQLPHVLDLVERAGHQPVVLVDQVHEVAERVVLPLAIGVVADAYGARPGVAREVVERRLGQRPFAADAVHDLEVVAGGERGLDEFHEAAGGPDVSHAEHRFDGHGGVAQPAEPIVPVAFLADRLGQARGDGREHGAVVVGEELQHEHAPLDDVVVAVVLLRAVRPVEPIDQRAAVFDLLAFDVDRDGLLVVGEQQEFVLLERDFAPFDDRVEREGGVEVLAVFPVVRAARFDILGRDAEAHLAPGVVRSRRVVDGEAGTAPHEAYVAVKLGRQVVLLLEGAVAGHVVEHLELPLVGRKAGREDIRVGDVALPDRIAAGDLEAERAAFRTVEQGGEYRGRVEVGEAEPFDAAPVGDERGGAAVADDAVVEVIHGVSCCFSAVLSGIRAAAAVLSGLRRPPFAGRLRRASLRAGRAAPRPAPRGCGRRIRRRCPP